jgi:type I restriction enzyme M protein
VRVGLRSRLRRFRGDRDADEFNRRNLRYFDFDVVMTNPPFAGDIKDTRILHQFDLARKPSGKWSATLGRDVLFIERNLEFLRPGGRMCIVLPQGRLNNVTDAPIRRFIAERARILAVVGLHPNTFKPHAGTKTSVLFLQKWNDDSTAGPRCPKVEDYPIFFATSQDGGKDSSGEYIYALGPDGRPLLDNHGHMVVSHDLDQIADAFITFARRQDLTFFQEDV